MEVGMRPRKFLIITGIIELLFLFPAFLFTVFFGYQGFVAGEMGNMIGMFSVALIYVSVSIWSAVVCLRNPGFKKRG